jgi:hypothetical protein
MILPIGAVLVGALCAMAIRRGGTVAVEPVTEPAGDPPAVVPS